MRAGDLVLVGSLDHGSHPHRRYATVERSGETGYVDEGKMAFLRTTTCG